MKIIFYHPDKVELGKSGSSVRPYNMLKTFQKLGFEVTLIDGKYEERLKKGTELISTIDSGESYDLLYIENTTLPLGLTIKTFPYIKLPYYSYASFDRFFIQKCLENNIQCKYFFRDIHWDFPEIFGKNYSWFKRNYLLNYQRFFGKKELYFLKNKVQLYVPSDEFKIYLKKKYSISTESLPPGSNIRDNVKKYKSGELTILYIGGISNLYFSDFLIRELERLANNIKIIICCRKKEYISYSSRFDKLQNKEIYHLSGTDLDQVYKKADVAIYPLVPSGYGKLSYSIKIPEYICNGKPIICFKNTICSTIVEQDEIGWSIEQQENSLNEIAQHLLSNPEEINSKTINTVNAQSKYTWEAVIKKLLK